MIKPTVGRVVLYNPLDSELESERHAALVAKVINDVTVNLAVFDEFGQAYHRQNVTLIQDAIVNPQPGQCEWMPYQHGQAAKYDTAMDAVLERLATIEKYLAAEGIEINAPTEVADIGISYDPEVAVQSLMNHAAVASLVSTEMLDSAGDVCLHDFDVYTSVKYEFDDGVVFVLSIEQYILLGDFVFPNAQGEGDTRQERAEAN